MKIILSIKPQYCDEIFAGEKRFEYRRKIFKRSVESVLVYATSPICKIVGEFEIDRVLEDTPESLWMQTSRYGGISHKSYSDYFHDTDTAYALAISNYIRYNKPLDPKSLDRNFVAPQSYRYLE